MQSVIEAFTRKRAPSATTVLFSLNGNENELKEAAARSITSGKPEACVLNTRSFRVISTYPAIIRVSTPGLFGTGILSTTRLIMTMGNRNI